MDLKSLDVSMFKKLTDPKLAGDLNTYLENLPEKAGHTILIAAGIAWAVAAAAGLFATIKVQQLTEFRNTVREAKALVPIVPKISDAGIAADEVKKFAETASNAYKDLTFTPNGSTLLITAKSTSSYAQFREAIGHVQNGGNGWRVSLQKFCVGRECDRQFGLAASLSINKVSVERP